MERQGNITLAQLMEIINKERKDRIIKENELRRNDLVFLAPSGKRHNTEKPRPCKVLEVHEGKVRVEDMGYKLSLFYGTEDLQPIPLTTEILEKCGSLKLPNWNSFGSTMIIINKETGIVYTESGLIGVSIINNNDGELVARTVSYLNYIKSLHQLQNLYYALTGTELEINL